MTRWAIIFHRKSLTFAFVALLVGFIALGFTVDFPRMLERHGTTFVRQAVLICITSLSLCVAVLTNLVLDVRRGYSPSRCSLACVIMLMAFAGPVMLAIVLAHHFSR